MMRRHPRIVPGTLAVVLATVIFGGMPSDSLAQFLPPLEAAAEAHARLSSDDVGPFSATVPSNAFVAESASAGGTSPFGSAFSIAQSTGSLSLHARSRFTSDGVDIDVSDDKNANTYARASNVSHWVAFGPPGTNFDLDVQLDYVGYLDVGAANLDDVEGFLSFGLGVLAEVDVYPHTPGMSAVLPIFRGLAGVSGGVGLDQNNDPAVIAQLVTTSGWSQNDFSISRNSAQPFATDDGFHAALSYHETIQGVASIPVGTVFAVESLLQTSSGDSLGSIPAGASSNFFNSGSFVLSTTTPGVSVVRVPEPTTLSLAGIVGAVLVLCMRKRRGWSGSILVPSGAREGGLA